tara:strand:- start:85217 stop:85729 length:513 start_codon:yes stop_codon:yes gene_type:complete
MGCDIHFYVEHFTTDKQKNGPIDIKEQRDRVIENVLEEKEENKTKQWISVDEWEKEEWDEDDFHWGVIYEKLYYRGRNYNLFEKLANVRSYNDNPTSEPRGIPDDISFSFEYICKQWEGDAHSHSYFTLTELLLQQNWSEVSPEFEETVNKMRDVDSNTDNVRCCFFFDN